MDSGALRILRIQILWLLLLVPISFKIELFSGVIVMIQDLLLPILIFFYFILYKKGIKLLKHQLPYIFLLGSFLMVFIATVISLFKVFDLIGLLKLIKYVIYVIALLLVSKDLNNRTLNKINNITIITISLTLLIYALNKINSSMSWSEYMLISTWNPEFMPTGFSNRVLSIKSFHFFISSNNHGIYGSYLALIFFVNFSNYIRSRYRPKKTLLILFLCTVNILLLTSRETFLLIFVTFFMYFFSTVFYKKFKIKLFLKFFMIITLSLVFIVFIINKYDIELSIIHKVENMISGLKSSGGDGSMNMRFTTWGMILYMLLSYPFLLLIGTGFNPTYFSNGLDSIASHFDGRYVSVPENLFLMFLSYGGLLAFLFICLFFYGLFVNLKKNKYVNEGMFLASFLLGLIITNNTGGSMIAELFLTQFGLVYFCVVNKS